MPTARKNCAARRGLFHVGCESWLASFIEPHVRTPWGAVAVDERLDLAPELADHAVEGGDVFGELRLDHSGDSEARVRW